MASRLVTVAVLIGLSSAWGADQQKDVFIVEVLDPPQWCGFTSEKEWRDVAGNQGDHVSTAAVRRISGVLSTIFTSADSEDWRTDEEYSVDARKNLTQLKRVTADFTYQINKEELWIIRGGKASRVSDVWKDPAGEPVKPVDLIARGFDRDFDYPAAGRIRDFAFAPLITDEHPERWAGGKRCIPRKPARKRL